MVGFIEPVGTSFQSANDDRTEKMTSPVISSGRSSRFQIRWAPVDRLVNFTGAFDWRRATPFKRMREVVAGVTTISRAMATLIESSL
jgi:hypothetical protein